MGLAGVAALRALRPESLKTLSGKAKSGILIFNGGAPSHHDLWDPKPEASKEIRGIFKTIKTAVPGIRVTELLPRMAKRMKPRLKEGHAFIAIGAMHLPGRQGIVRLLELADYKVKRVY